ncbi:MAG: peptidoglycan-binding domain-containing protein [Elainellaceae cyanobacterium]
MTQIGADRRNRHNAIWRAIATGSLAVGVSFGLTGVGLLGEVAIAQSSASPSNPPANAVPGERETESSQRPDQPLLQLGSTGAEVRQVQAMLTLLGFYADPIDGQFGASTAIAVTRFQTVAGLVADGIVGPSTWSRLLPTPERLAAINAETIEDEQVEDEQVEDEQVEDEQAEDEQAEDEQAAVASPASSTFPVPESVTRQETLEDVPQDSSPQDSPNTPQSPSTVDEAARVELPTLRRGMQGSAVTALQEKLQVLGLFSGAIDGVFGPQTEAAVKDAQRRFQLNPDGIVGRETWTALLRF